MSQWLGLSGRTAVVTGAGGGIGKAVALELSANGVRCNVLDRASELVDATVAEIAGNGGQATGHVCDVTDEAAIEAVAASIKTCDILVNAAGLVRPGALADLTTVEWNDLLKVNLTGYFLMARTFAPHLVASGLVVYYFFNKKTLNKLSKVTGIVIPIILALCCTSIPI